MIILLLTSPYKDRDWKEVFMVNIKKKQNCFIMDVSQFSEIFKKEGVKEILNFLSTILKKGDRMKKKILICVQRDITNAVSWAFKDLTLITGQFIDHIYQLEKILATDSNFSVLIIDSALDGESTLSFFCKELKKN